MVGRRKPIPGLRRNNSGNLPVSDELIQDSRRVAPKPLILTEGQVVDVAEHEAMASVEIGIAVFQSRVGLQPEVALILRTEASARGVVERMAVGIGRFKLEAIRKSFLEAELQAIVIRIEIRAQGVDTGIDIRIGPATGRWTVGIGGGHRLITIEKAEQMRAVRADVRNLSNGVRRQLVLKAREPLLHEGCFDPRTD